MFDKVLRSSRHNYELLMIGWGFTPVSDGEIKMHVYLQNMFSAETVFS